MNMRSIVVYLLEVGNSFPQSVEVKVVSNVVLVDLDEELVTLEVAEPLNPAGTGLTVVLVVQV